MWKEIVFFLQQYRNLPQTETWKIFSYQETLLKFVQLKCERDLQYSTNLEELLKCERNLTLKVEDMSNILQEWKHYWNVEVKEEPGMFSKLAEIFHKWKCEWLFHIRIHFWNMSNLKCGRYFNILQKSSTNENVKDYFIFKYISEIC